MQRLLFVSNRLPVSIIKKKGSLQYYQSAGGLATGLSSFYQNYESLWLGWPGIITNNTDERLEITSKLKAQNMYSVFLSRSQIEKYYEGFSNKTIWPLFHYFTQHTLYDKSFWQTYRNVNKLFCDEIVKVATPEDIIWIHDYQLMLLPQLVREKLPDSTIGFFLHIPFPSFEIFRALPWREEILNGVLGADLIGFHTYDYARHFLSSVTRIRGLESTMGKIRHEERVLKVDSFPMGIDYDKFANASQDHAVEHEIKKIKKLLSEQKIILSIDRLDYSKAIPQRLKALEEFLSANPGYQEKIKLILVVVPSRSKVETYRLLKEEVDELVGRINGKFGTIGWTPIWYLYRNLQFPMLSALYNLADVALVTPFRDGMNLIAKEYIASKTDGIGVLILSEMAGASDELGEAITINPNDMEDIKDALGKALAMTESEQIRLNREMQQKLKRYSVNRWAEDFINSLSEIKYEQYSLLTKGLNREQCDSMFDSFQKSKRRLLFLDYDGTLVDFSKLPEAASPDTDLLDLLSHLSQSPLNEIVVISGRDKTTLDNWLGGLDINLVAEHGAWLRLKGESWETIEYLKQDWKKDIRPLLELYVDRTPGSLIESKDFSLAWHYRKADPGLGEIRARQLMDTLLYLTSNLDLQVLEGSKVIEVKNSGINKGKAAEHWLNQQKWDFVLAIGDDWTDEDLFRVMPTNAYSIKVGLTPSVARFYIKSPENVRQVLNQFVKESKL